MILLSAEERIKFSTYLKESAASDKQMMEIQDNMNIQLGMSKGLRETLYKKFNTEMTAKLFISNILDGTEDA